MKDRVVQYPGRYQLVPVAGTTDTFDLVAVPGIVTAEGTLINKASLLKDFTAELLGLIKNPGDDPTVDDALLASFLMAKNAAIVQLSVTLDGTTAPEGIVIGGLTASDGGVCKTNASGIAIGLTTLASTTVQVSGYVDINNATKTVDTPLQTIVEDTLALTSPSTTEKTFSVTTTGIKFSPNVTKVDACVVGGGGGGGCGGVQASGVSVFYGGGGGGQGYIVNSFDIEVTPNESYTATIGAGGTGAQTSLTNGTSGGQSSFAGVTANGGGGGGGYKDGGSNGGGQGAYNDQESWYGPGTAGASNTTIRAFNAADGTLYGGGGGGAGDGVNVWNGYAKGSPNGGIGGTVINTTPKYANGSDATGYGGGGGGGFRNGSNGYGGNGFKGLVRIRWEVA